MRLAGIAANDEELESAQRPIAAPVRSSSGEVAAAVNIAIPHGHPSTITELAGKPGRALQATAHQIAAGVI